MALTIRKILKEHWPEYIKHNKVTDYQKAEVEKAVNCSKKSCNGRICSSCGKRYSDEWADRTAEYILPVEHCHVVLTISGVLREGFRDWEKLKILMDASSGFMRKSNKCKVAMIAILHTFGKDLKFNPHIHIIAAKIWNVGGKKFSKLWRSRVLSDCDMELKKYRYGFYFWNDLLSHPKGWSFL
jgi:hypothetical protein